MKKKLIFFSLIIFTGYILFCPQTAVGAARDGLILWYERVLPTLLPFSILSNILIYSNYLQYMTRLFAPALKKLMHVSENGAFVLLSGFLFGFPMGSKNCAELLKCNRIRKEEAEILFIITNNISPVFISSYILSQQIQMPSMIVPSFLILFLPPLLLGGIWLKQVSIRKPTCNTKKKPASGSQMNFKIIDAGIMNGFETLTRLGGYIMLFSMIASMMQILPASAPVKAVITGAIEITNGISQLAKIPLPAMHRYILAMSFTAFGGLSGIAQTSSMVRDTGLSMKKYIFFKLILTGISLLSAWFIAVCIHL